MDALAKIFAPPLVWFYGLVHSYGVAIMLITFVIMIVLTPLTLKSTKGMLEMQLLQPEIKRLQAEHRGDRQKLSEETMKLYQQHKVNPLASCLPMLAQAPVFIGMYRLLRGLTNREVDGVKFENFQPKFISKTSELYESLHGKTVDGKVVIPGKNEMVSFGLDLAKAPSKVMSESFGKGLIYAGLVVLLGVLYWVQSRMIASRTVNPTMSAGQQKLMQYLPVAFAPIQLFFPTGLVIYYMTQTVLRIAQQAYITRRFYHGDNALGTRAQDASKAARDLGKDDGGVKPVKGALPDRGPDKPSRPTPSKPSPNRPSPPAKGGTAPKGTATPPSQKGARPTPSNQPKPAGSRHPKPKKN